MKGGALCLDRGQIPGTLHDSEPNPQLDLANTPFMVSGELTQWPRGRGDSAGWSERFWSGNMQRSCGAEETPDADIRGTSAATALPAARAPAALEAQCARLADRLELADPASFSPADAAYTLAVGRRAFAHRLAMPAIRVRGESIAQLRTWTRCDHAHPWRNQSPRVAMLFPGQGTQYPGMAEELIERNRS